MEKEVIVKGHNKSSWGKNFGVRTYKRRVGRKGMINWKTSMRKKGQNVLNEPEQPKIADPFEEGNLSAKEWDASYRKIETERRRKIREQLAPINTTSPEILEIDKKQRDMFQRAEDKISKFVEKYTSKQYKRMF